MDKNNQKNATNNKNLIAQKSKLDIDRKEEQKIVRQKVDRKTIISIECNGGDTGSKISKMYNNQQNEVANKEINKTSNNSKPMGHGDAFSKRSCNITKVREKPQTPQNSLKIEISKSARRLHILELKKLQDELSSYNEQSKTQTCKVESAGCSNKRAIEKIVKDVFQNKLNILYPVCKEIDKNFTEKVNEKTKAVALKNDKPMQLSKEVNSKLSNFKLGSKSADEKHDSSNDSGLENNNLSKKREIQRKPMVKTIKAKNDDKVYKAVTFVSRNHEKPKSLDIEIPNDISNKISRATETVGLKKKLDITINRVGTKDITVNSNKVVSNKDIALKRDTSNCRRKVKRRDKKSDSTSRTVCEEAPRKEVAKWAPSCLNEHTKPYYEAWVDTTLTAISRNNTKDDLYFKKKKILEDFKKSLEKAESEDWANEHINGEKYAGKIKITHKQRRKVGNKTDG